MKKNLLYLVARIGFTPLLLNQVMAQTATINLNTTYQTIRGIGGANIIAWTGDLTPIQADLAFGNGNGQIGMSILRIRVSPDNTQWKQEVATAKIAKSHGAIIFATPWTPPASMKDNNSLVWGSLKTSSYAAYASHLKSFSTFMSTNGAPLYAISIQNEPDYQVTYESCSFTSAQFIDFLTNNAASIGNRIISPESFQFKRPLSDAILNNAAAAANLSIVGGHIYGAGLADYPLARQKGKDVWMTEHYTESNNSGNAWPLALDVGTEIHNCMAANFNAYVWWYIRRSYGLIDESGTVTKRGYLMAQYSKFIRPGSVRVDVPNSPITNVNATAYKKGDSVILVLVNKSTSTQSLKITLQNNTKTIPSFTKYTTSASKNVNNDGKITVTSNSFTASLDAQSVTTFVGIGTLVTGLEEEFQENAGYAIYPNPFTENVVVEGKGEFSYELHTLSGERIQAGSAENKVILGDKVTTGMYILKVRQKEETRMFKVNKF
jgi:O-glycosyl hydrolase